MKKLFSMVLILSMLLLLAGCHIEHLWVAADCTSPKTCMECGETEGTALGHDWQEADCEHPKTCARCGLTEGSALGHDWVDADCEHPQTCKRCNQTKGDALGHDVPKWKIVKQATCTETGLEAGTCNRCGNEVEQEIECKPHSPGAWKIIFKPTSATNGLKVKKCYVCGQTVEREDIVLTAEEKIEYYKRECSNYSYNSVARDPYAYNGTKGKISGRVIQVMEDGNEYTLRVAMGGSYHSVVLATYTRGYNEARILEDDWVSLYGLWKGTYTYESVLGQSITVPFFKAKYLN